MHPEDVAGNIVSASHRRDDHVALVLPATPVDGVILPVNADIEPFDIHFRNLAFLVGEEGESLPVEEVDAPVEHAGSDVGRLADAAQRHLAGKHPQDQVVLAGLDLAGRGVDALGLDGEGVPALLAAVALAADLRLSVGVVGFGRVDRNPVILAQRLRA